MTCERRFVDVFLTNQALTGDGPLGTAVDRSDSKLKRLSLELSSSVRKVRSIELRAYNIAAPNADEALRHPQDELVVLDLDGAYNVHSNSIAMHGVFAVLKAGEGKHEGESYATHIFRGDPGRRLEFGVFNSRGESLNMDATTVQLWLRLCVDHA